MTATITAEGLVKRYGALTALELDRLRLEPGKLLAVVGANGAGKTTLLELCALLRPADGGRLTVLGVEVAGNGATGRVRRDGRSLRGRVTMVMEKAYLFRGSSRDNVELGLAGRGLTEAERTARTTAALAAVAAGTLAERRVETLSAGERQRVAIARAVAIQPELLILDEPTASIDRLGVPVVEQLLRSLASDRGTAVLFSTHDLAQAERLADEVLCLEGGRRSDSMENGEVV